MCSFLINPFIYAAAAPVCSGDLINTWNLSAYYKLNSDATDSSGNAMNMNVNGTPTYSAGKFDNAIDLDGTSQYLSRSSNALFGGSGGTISVFGWMKITDFSSDANQHLASRWNGSSTGWRIVARSSDILLSLAGSNYGGGSGVPTGTWVHIGFTFDNNTYVIYQDGVSVGTAAVGAKNVNQSGAQPYIGRRNSGADGYVKGQIDDVNIWQRALDATEVSTLYSTGCPLKS